MQKETKEREKSRENGKEARESKTTHSKSVYILNSGCDLHVSKERSIISYTCKLASTLTYTNALCKIFFV